MRGDVLRVVCDATGWLVLMASLLATDAVRADWNEIGFFEVDEKLSPIGVDANVREFGRSVAIGSDGQTYIGAVQRVGPPSLGLPATGVVWQNTTNETGPERVIGSTDREAYLAGRTESFGAQLALSSEGLVVSHQLGILDGQVFVVPPEGNGGYVELMNPIETEQSFPFGGYGSAIAASERSPTVFASAPRATPSASVHRFVQGSEDRTYSVETFSAVTPGDLFGRSLAFLEGADASDLAIASQLVMPGAIGSTQRAEATLVGVDRTVFPSSVLNPFSRITVAANRFEVAVFSDQDQMVLVGDPYFAPRLELRVGAPGFVRDPVTQLAMDERYLMIESDIVSNGSGSAEAVLVIDLQTGLELGRVVVANDAYFEGDFGDSLAIADGVALIGAPEADDGAGAVYRVDLDQLDLPGDFNADDRINNADLNLLLDNWGRDPDELSADWRSGRPLYGMVDNGELGELLEAWGRSRTPSEPRPGGVPEPTALALVTVLAAVLLIGVGSARRDARASA